MKSGLDHLPEGKRRELGHVVATVRAGCAEAIAHRTQPRYRAGKLLKIVLIGSYARGDWVEEPVGRYFSDYDLLVVVNHDDLTDIAQFWEATESRLLADLSAGTVLRTPVSLIYHSLEDVNDKLRLGRYFFMDILNDGVVLFEEAESAFVQPMPLSCQQALEATQDYFKEWFESARDSVERAYTSMADQQLKFAAFDLHQATERLYHCLFLVRTLYSPKTHNLNRLRDMAEELEPVLKDVWPRTGRFEKRCYALLRDAYVKARYAPSYRISADELAWIAGRVEVLQGLVKSACEARIEVLAKAA
ncbi:MULTISPECIES: HEPN domain-containing protein [unclassified Novosphingobium]|uniref:HEPN domain-containing protein n=1 Tax=unclassified Novosphingobium TaxID=2644732 RepID=UPI0018806972|nr:MULTISPECIES: HEPN domain-containing protein [unclassified Novosphingobium]MCW1384506.1 HEPN domain-containing protein [Novosphingobium sp. KCTC 2891]QOV96645.1 HEPN domain-containing protein [Novosphingobium sp. ES2-1]